MKIGDIDITNSIVNLEHDMIVVQEVLNLILRNNPNLNYPSQKEIEGLKEQALAKLLTKNILIWVSKRIRIMGIFDAFKTTTPVKAKETFNFLVVAALQEELNEFYKINQSFNKKSKKDGNAYEVSYTARGKKISILTYTPNKMGMPFNAASLMNIISIHKPIFTLMIGTCACIAKNHNLGDVLIPDRVFSYESGKYEKGEFKPDYAAHSTGEELRRHAELQNHN